MMISRSKHRSTVEVCADCGASDPSWASINRGLLLCAECCSVHRSMGRHISHVKSLRQGTWPPSLLAMVQALNAQNVNSIWEHSLLDTSAPKHLRKKPQPKDPLHPTKSEFILAKHLRLAYVLRARRDEPPSELGRQLHSAVRSSSLDTAMRLLAQGADPNYYNQEKGCNCLHVACRAGQAAQAELLAAWGADPGARDHAGHTPADTARLGGHIALAERMVELVYEATDRLVCVLTGARPSHAGGRHYAAPRDQRAHEMTDVAKAARGKLQLLPNHLFEELVMDIYDEIDRRETEAIWQTSATGLERCGVVFLPVNPALSAPRNQGRQKLARLSTAEMATLLRDVLADAARRQHIATLQPRALQGLVRASHLSDDEPLYDSVASDDDYASLLPIDVDMRSILPRAGDAVSSTYNPSLPSELSIEPRTHSPAPAAAAPPAPAPQIETLKKELDSRDSTITELKTQLKNLQTIVEQLTKENSVLKTTSSFDDNSIASVGSIVDSTSNGLEVEKPQERGKSLEAEMAAADDVKAAKGQRPVSMFEAREGPRNNWHVTKHQLATLSGLDRALTQGVLDEAPLPSTDMVHRRAEVITRGIQELWAAAREQEGRLAERADSIRTAVRALLALFPQNCPDAHLDALLSDLRLACEQVTAAAAAPAPLPQLSAAAYDLAKATKQLVTHFTDERS
ncbi:ARF GTPase-activating protein Git [Plutella xylostella]|uniref:ARF GTPase-activating protein Git n=1 Tax=Plutella xylostella TaxID=51655 RepID=UPI00203226BD|nr:ARF GTPase-activating protein Git [Plutella xylostella]